MAWSPTPGFRLRVLRDVRDPQVQLWWAEQQPLMKENYRWWLEIIRPVQDKVNVFALYDVARNIFGQPDTTLDLPALLAQGAVVLVNTAAGLVGAESSALVGATLVDIVSDFLRSQGARALAADRRRVMVVVDEFHTIPADYEGFASELAKFGGHLVLGTQSLRRLDALDVALRPVLFSNVNNLFVFQSSAEDAELLVGELDEAVTVTDVVNLADYACYVKASRGEQRLGAFSITTLPPQPGDPDLAQAIAAASAQRYGRPRAEVERHIAHVLQQHYEGWKDVVARMGGATSQTVGTATSQDGDQQPDLKKLLADSGQGPPFVREGLTCER